jgi:2-amino-4-hydroxy-6-hydroxymethyldihydropteridine diphosphokinase
LIAKLIQSNYPITRLSNYPIEAAIALGSNVGDRAAHLDFAVARLSHVLSSLKTSRWYETEWVGDDAAARPRVLNGAATGATSLSARELLDALLALERERGRERGFAGAPRTLDLDLVLFGDRVVNEPGLIVPHPRFRQRRFVLEPLAEIASEMIDPVTGKTVSELLAALSSPDTRPPPRA